MTRPFWQQVLWALGEALAATPLRRIVLKPEGTATNGQPLFSNRINGHMVICKHAPKTGQHQ